MSNRRSIQSAVEAHVSDQDSDSHPSDEGVSVFDSEAEAEVEGWQDASEDGDSGDDGEVEDDRPIFRYPPGARDAKPKTGRQLEKEKILVAHFERLSEPMKNVAMLFVQALGNTSKQSEKWLKRNRPPLDMRDCLDGIPDVQYGKYWTRDDEERLQAGWRSDPLRHQMEKLEVKKNKEILPMWKLVRRFLRCWPAEIISRQTHLEYYRDVRVQGTTIVQPNWSKTFCKRLGPVGIHGFFQFNPSLVVLGLQYVVFCRTDYRGTVPWANQGTDRFLDLFLVKMQDQDGSKSVVQIHREVLQHFASLGKVPTSHVSHLFRGIEQRAFKKNPDQRGRTAAVPIFKVRTEDLAVLIRAANAIKPTGAPAFLPLSIIWRIVVSGKKSHDAPRDLAGLNELRSRLVLQDRREEIIRSRRDEDGAKDDDGSASDLYEVSPRSRRGHVGDVVSGGDDDGGGSASHSPSEKPQKRRRGEDNIAPTGLTRVSTNAMSPGEDLQDGAPSWDLAANAAQGEAPSDFGGDGDFVQEDLDMQDAPMCCPHQVAVPLPNQTQWAVDTEPLTVEWEDPQHRVPPAVSAAGEYPAARISRHVDRSQGGRRLLSSPTAPDALKAGGSARLSDRLCHGSNIDPNRQPAILQPWRDSAPAPHGDQDLLLSELTQLRELSGSAGSNDVVVGVETHGPPEDITSLSYKPLGLDASPGRPRRNQVPVAFDHDAPMVGGAVGSVEDREAVAKLAALSTSGITTQ
ncbi:hypothetical protein F4779DRAFT_579101 [Xylariaceae sp. FL0662B]|nr:hypothetical protein F4779DRAFT_579101 [Xylariaceae sp. FL0662B]